MAAPVLKGPQDTPGTADPGSSRRRVLSSDLQAAVLWNQARFCLRWQAPRAQEKDYGRLGIFEALRETRD